MWLKNLWTAPYKYFLFSLRLSNEEQGIVLIRSPISWKIHVERLRLPDFQQENRLGQPHNNRLQVVVSVVAGYVTLITILLEDACFSVFIFLLKWSLIINAFLFLGSKTFQHSTIEYFYHLKEIKFLWLFTSFIFCFGSFVLLFLVFLLAYKL